MNATSLFPISTVQHLLQNAVQQTREQMRSSQQRYLYTLQLRSVCQQLNECELILRHARTQLTLLVAEKLHLRTLLLRASPQHQAELQQRYDELHELEQQVLQHFRQGSHKLGTCREMFCQVRDVGFVQRHGHGERLQQVVETLASIRERHQQLGGEVRGLLQSR